MNLKQELYKLQSYSIELGRLEAATDAIGHDVILNGNGETLKDRKDFMKNRVNEIREKLLNEIYHQT